MALRVVVKIGTSSVTCDSNSVNVEAIEKLAKEVATAHSGGHEILVVTSGAIAAGLKPLGMTNQRPRDLLTLQAVSAVGQSRLMKVYNDCFSSLGLVGGQVLLAPLDFLDRRQYLHARQTLLKLLELKVIPVINENDVIADDEIRFGDNDRLAALVANLVSADLLVLLTDTPGVFSSDPRIDPNASLIQEVESSEREISAVLGGPGTEGGSGGMASKLSAARMAAWSGVASLIAAANRPDVLTDALQGMGGTGTFVHPHSHKLPARKLWIAFALSSKGYVVVDKGAKSALVESGGSLLPAGVVSLSGDFEQDEAIEIVSSDRKVFAKGLARLSSRQLDKWKGSHTSDLPRDISHEVVHRDDLVILSSN